LEGKINGVELSKQAKNHNIPLIFVTANQDKNTANKAKLTESYNFIAKPFEIEELKYKVS
jgi:DNA-binding NtrC family response regulator